MCEEQVNTINEGNLWIVTKCWKSANNRECGPHRLYNWWVHTKGVNSISWNSEKVSTEKTDNFRERDRRKDLFIIMSQKIQQKEGAKRHTLRIMWKLPRNCVDIFRVHTVTVVVLYNNLPPVIKWQTGATTFFIKQTSTLVNNAGARSRRVKLYTPISQFNG